MMKKLGQLTTFAITLATASGTLLAEQWKIDPAHSAAQFAVKHMMVSTVRGHFGTMNGAIDYDPADPAKAKVVAEVDVTSIDTRNGKRDDHLRSADFFDAANHPKLKFESTRIERLGDGLRMIGNLTIRGVTREVVFDVEGPAPPINTGRGIRSGATATTTISRKDFGMTWNRAIEAGGVTVGDEVTLTVDIEMTAGGGQR